MLINSFSKSTANIQVHFRQDVFMDVNNMNPDHKLCSGHPFHDLHLSNYILFLGPQFHHQVPMTSIQYFISLFVPKDTDSLQVNSDVVVSYITFLGTFGVADKNIHKRNYNVA